MTNKLRKLKLPLVEGRWEDYRRSPKPLVETGNTNLNVKDKQGTILSSEKDQADRWVQHFKEVLNHPAPEEDINVEPSENMLDINLDPPSEDEVRKAI